jgi:drug/metabolite transporter (DMT)-like permease
VTTPAEQRRALALLALCGLCWSTAGVLLRVVSWHPGAIWSARSAIVAVALFAIARPRLSGITRVEWASAVALAATTGLFILANKLTTAANAILIQYSAPVWVALFGQWFLGERATRADWLAIALVVAGIALFFVDRISLDHTAGNVAALGAGIAFAVGTLTIRRIGLRPELDPFRAIWLGNAAGALAGAPFWSLGPLPDATGWAALLALGLVQQTAAYLCYARAVRHARALEIMLIPVIEPILSPLWVALAFGEWPSAWALAGGVLVLGAVTARALVGRRSGAG